MNKREAGFSLVEILITLAILSIVLAAITDTFVNLLRGFKQQGKIAETSIEGVIGLEMLRRDLESAGYGLPWVIPAGASYTEKSAYGDASSNPPRAILSGTAGAGFLSGTDYLVIKAVNVARNSACSKWTNLFITGGTPTTTVWDPASENPGSNDRVIVISPGATEALARSLVASGGSYTTTFSLVTGFAVTSETRIVYGVDPDSAIRRPFNRADYYVKVPTNSDMPSRCATGTGILYKNVLNQADDSLSSYSLPLFDCVADMQVVTRHDTNNDGVIDTDANGLEGTLATNAQTIRSQLKEVRVFILAHEGQKDSSFTYPLKPGTCDEGKILVGDSAAMGRCFDLAANIADWQNYRWKVYTLVVKPNNLR